MSIISWVKSVIVRSMNAFGYSLMETKYLKDLEDKASRSRNISERLEKNTREARMRVQPNSLLNYYSNIYSQRGDDGIIAEIFRRIGVKKGFFVEFGAWDGLYLSNCRLLFENGWGGMFIEADKEKYLDLTKEYKKYPDVYCVNELVSPDGREGKKLDEIIKEYGPDNQEIDFISIDIDGLDLNILESLENKPKALCIEGGFSWHPSYKKRVPDEIATENLQQPLAVAVESVIKKEYIPVCFNQNLYAVRKEYLEHFKNIENTPKRLYLDAFFYFTEEFRKDLVNLRKSHKLIRKIEKKYVEVYPGY